MEGVSLNPGPAGVLANEGGSAVTRSRDDRDAQPGGQPPQNEPRVNEGPSTRSSISTQGLELARQDPVPGSGESPQVSQDNRQAGAQQAENQSSDSAGQDGRLIDDDSPNELLRG